MGLRNLGCQATDCKHTYIHTYIHTCIHTYIHTYIHNIHIIHSRDSIDSTDVIEMFDTIGNIHVALNFVSMYDFYFFAQLSLHTVR